jgi:L,D-transpeptidase ErfK/SrfK
MRGEDVGELQTALRRLAVYDGPLDSVFSAETGAAVTAARMKWGLSPVARADSAFWRALATDWLAAHVQVRQAAAASGPSAPPEGDLFIVINIEAARLTLYADGYPYKSYPVAVGRPGTPSAVGQWQIRNKGINVGAPFGTRWLGLTVPWGIYGIHGTNNPGSIGYMASGGCIRMFNWDVEELYEWVEIGTPVHIISPNWTASVYPSLPTGTTGLGVVFLQWQLQRLGWNPGEADGRLGEQTIEVIRDLEAFYGLPVDGVTDADVLLFLDLGR